MFKLYGQVFQIIGGKRKNITAKVKKAVQRLANKILKENKMECIVYQGIIYDERIEKYLLFEMEKTITNFFNQRNISTPNGWVIEGLYSRITNENIKRDYPGTDALVS